jgi:hypothetical protein
MSRSAWFNSSTDQQVASVPAGARLCQSLAAACGQCEHVVQLAIRQQSAIGGDRRTVEPEHHSPVEIEPQRPAVRFTRRVRHGCPVRSCSTYCSLYDNQTHCTAKYGTIRECESRSKMPKGPRGEKRPADVIGNAVKVMRIAMPAAGTDRIIEKVNRKYGLCSDNM